MEEKERDEQRQRYGDDDKHGGSPVAHEEEEDGARKDGAEKKVLLKVADGVRQQLRLVAGSRNSMSGNSFPRSSRSVSMPFCRSFICASFCFTTAIVTALRPSERTSPERVAVFSVMSHISPRVTRRPAWLIYMAAMSSLVSICESKCML